VWKKIKEGKRKKKDLRRKKSFLRKIPHAAVVRGNEDHSTGQLKKEGGGGVLISPKEMAF